jgi:hypothetical protein
VVGCLSHFSAEEGVDERVQRLSIEMAKQRVRDLICGGFMFDASEKTQLQAEIEKLKKEVQQLKLLVNSR